MKSFKVLFLLFMLLIFMGASNSLVSIEDISKMKKAGVSQQLIDYLISHQTCSIDANTVIHYHEAGLKEPVILTLIQADAYRPEHKSTVEKELKIIEGLKQAGVSDEAILEYLNSVRSNDFVDTDGNKSYRIMPPMDKELSHRRQSHKKKFQTPLPYPATIEVNP